MYHFDYQDPQNDLKPVKQRLSRSGCVTSPTFICRCEGLLLLETYTTKVGVELDLPDFLDLVREVTDDPHYSMYHLSAHEN